MMPAFMRFVKSEAGHIEKLEVAVRAASSIASNDPLSQRRAFLELWNSSHSIDQQLKSLRSAESHLSFARELGLLNQRGSDRTWHVTPSVGKAFLLLVEKRGRPPTGLLLAQLITNDKDILLPYLLRVLERPTERHDYLFLEAWHEFYHRFRDQLSRMEPLVPSTLKLRTCRHHVEARDKFLSNSKSGLGLSLDSLHRLVKFVSVQENLDNITYKLIANVIFGTDVKECDDQRALALVEEYYPKLAASGFASALGTWFCINEQLFPYLHLPWQKLLDLLLGDSRFSVQPSFNRRDLLYCLREKACEMQVI